MEKINVYDLDGNKKEVIDMPKIFERKPRKDLIHKAIEVSQSKKVQSQGRDERAGLRNTAEGWGTGHGMSRAPRIKGSGFPTARNVGRVPFARGGRQTHPIKSKKNRKKKINKKLNKISLISAISASGNKEWVKKRGHLIDQVPQIPFVVDDKIQTIKKTSQIYSKLSELGFKEEMERVKKNSKKIRAGKGKRRGRKYKKKISILIVIKEDFGIYKAARNIPGIDVVQLENLSINDLAPGGLSGRLIIWTQSAFNDLEKYRELI
jgi:large subunit ribosomal protein L4e